MLSKWKYFKLRRMYYKQLKAGIISVDEYFEKIARLRKEYGKSQAA